MKSYIVKFLCVFTFFAFQQSSAAPNPNQYGAMTTLADGNVRFSVTLAPEVNQEVTFVEVYARWFNPTSGVWEQVIATSNLFGLMNGQGASHEINGDGTETFHYVSNGFQNNPTRFYQEGDQIEYRFYFYFRNQDNSSILWFQDWRDHHLPWTEDYVTRWVLDEHWYHETISFNHEPVAIAEGPIFTEPFHDVALTGSKSYDPDGNIVAYQWIQTEGPTVELFNSDSAEAQFIAPDIQEEAVITFQLCVTDNSNAQSCDSVSIDILIYEENLAPISVPVVLNKGAEAFEYEQVRLDGSGSYDLDGDIVSYEWIQVSGIRVPIQNANTAFPTFIAPKVFYSKDFVFALVVRDDDGETDSKLTSIFIKQLPNEDKH